MLKPLRPTVIAFLSGLILSLLIPYVSLAQCNGADGTGIYFGSVANVDNGTICANTPILPAVMEIDIRNVLEGAGQVKYVIDWADGTNQTVNATKIATNRFFASISHTFPPNGGNVRCEYRPTVRIQYGNNAPCAASLGVPPRFVRWNTDDQNTGRLEVNETVTGQNVYQVCAGVQTNVTFTDRSVLNCVPPDLTLGQNDKMRWRRFEYGTANTITGTVLVGGTPHGYPYNGPVDASTEPTINSGFPTSTTKIITVPATAQVGEFFEITMDYWNTCNPYPAGRTPVSRTARILIVGQPPPPTSSNQTVCNGTTPSNFSLGGVPGGNLVTWYRNVPGAPETAGTVISQGTSTSLPIGSVPGYAGNTTAAVYKVWASYRPNVANALNCESPLIQISRTIKENLTVPNPTTAPPQYICTGTSFAVGLTAPATETIGGATQYVFGTAAGITVGSSTANSATYNVAVAFLPGELYVDRTITISRRYTNAPNCQVDRNFNIRVYNNPVGGTPSNFPDVCEGTPIGPITLSGQLGTIKRWEIKIDAGPWNTYAGPASGNSITPGVLPSGALGTTYSFRAIVGNPTTTGPISYPCADAISSVETVLVSPNPGLTVDAGLDQQWCNVLSTSLNGSDPTPGTGTWTYESSVPAGRPSPSFTPGNRFSPISVTAGNEGAYTMRWTVVSGSCTFIDDVVIDFGKSVVIPPMPNIDVCGETATLAAPALTVGTGLWTCTGGACAQVNIVDPTSPTSDVTLNGPPYSYGSYTFTWTVSSGNCVNTPGSVNVRFDEPIVPTAADFAGPCLSVSGGTTINLSGTFNVGAATSNWTVVSGGTGAISANAVAGNTVTATYTSTALDYSTGGPIVFRLTVNPLAPSVCAAATKDITVTVDRTPVIPAMTPIGTCNSFVQLAAENPIPYGATGLWTGPVGVTFDDPTNPTTFARNLPAPTSTFNLRWTLTSGGGNSCPAFADVSVTRSVAPAAANLDLILCADPSPATPMTTSVRLQDYATTVTAMPPASVSIAWYQDAAPPSGIPVADPTVTFTNVPDGKVYIARITETATGCTSDAIVSINVRSIPTANHGVVALCEDTPGSNTASNIDLTDVDFKDAVTNGSNTVTWFNSLSGAQNNTPADEITAPINVVAGLTVYARVSYSSGTLCVNVAPLDLSVKPLPTNTAILGRSTVCQGDPSILDPNLLPVETYQVTPITGAKYFWTIPTGPGEFKEFGGGTQSDFFVLLQFPNVVDPGIDISVRIELNGCSTPDIPLNIRVTPQPVKPIIAGPDIVCENDDGLLYNINPTNFPSSNYTWEVRKVSDNSLGGAFIKSGQGTDQIAVKYSSDRIYLSVKEVNSICVSDTTQYWVTVNRRPIMFDPSPDPEVCSGSPINVVFAPDASSPVPIDRYDINLFSRQSATLNFVVPAGGPVFPAPGVAPNAIQNHTFENLQAIPLSVKYNVTPISEQFLHVCPGQPVDLVIVIKPEPQLDPALGRSICSEQETGITLLSAANTFPADKFVISSLTYPAGVTPVGALPAADGVTLYNDDIIFHNAFINTTGVNQTVKYDIAPYSSLLGCLGDPPTPINVVIYPQTIVDPVVVAPICNGDPLNVTFTSANNPDATFEWLVKTYDPNINVLSTGAGAGNITNMLIVNTSNSIDGTVTFEVRGKNPPTEDSPDGCDNPPLTFVLTIKKSPVANAQSLVACSDVPGGNTYTVDLTSLATFVNPDAGTPAINLVWYRTDPRLGPATVITTPELPAFVMSNASPIFVEVEDTGNGCKKVTSIQYTINPSIQANITKTDLSCNGDNSGSIRVDIAPGTGTPAFSYRIDGGPFINAGASTYTFNSLAAANHTIEVQDSKACGISQPVLITEPAALNASLTIDNPITCFLGSDGQISTQATGGTTPYASYLLLQTNTTNTTGVFPNLTLGTYSVRVTDNNGCKVDTAPVPLPQPTAVEINNVAVLADANGFNLSCRDAVDGEVAVTFSGGNVPNDYTVTMIKASDPGNPLNINTPTSPATFTNLGFGNYSIIVKDAKGCPSLPASAIIVNPPPFSPGFVGINQSICVGDDAAPIQQLVPAFGGVGNYQYQWQQSITGSMIDADWIDIPGATNTTYDPGVLPQTVYFRRLAKSVSVRTNVACQILGKDNIVQVLINPLPAVTFSAPSEVCQGESFTLSINMTGGAAPIEYDYSSGSTTFLNLIGTENTFIPISNFQAPQTYTLLRVKDLNGCMSPNVPLAVDVDIIKLNPDFQVLAPSEQCSGGTFTFQWVAEADVKYTWIWSDGQQTIINPGERPLGTNTITHVFTSGSTDASTVYPVRLQVENALCAPKFATKPITVFPNVVLNILPGDPTLCSGESIRFIDQSNGVDVGKWYYHVVGSTEQLEVKAGPIPDITYTMTNITTANPIDYEVVYEAANNEGCSATYKLPVKVFRNILAVIGNNPDPPTPFTGGISTVEFVNNSNPLDAAEFEYTWDFGDARAQPATGTGINPITVDYFSAGIKDVKLTAVNIAARAANKTCQSVVVKKVIIDLPMLGAAFKATPLASCFPVNITVENLSPGADTFLWEVYNESGLVTTSNLREPEFRILTPGVYDIYLTASFYATGQTATANQKGIEVFDVPTALFEMRPNPLYVPDTELQTFNQSARATQYFWDFDDGTTSMEFQPRHLYQLEGKYMVTLVAGYDHGPKDIDGDGIIDGNVVCYDSVRNELVARDGGFVKLPNAFTPSPNGPNGGVAGSGTFNDVFLPIARGVEEFSMQVFDRWGNLVFESKDRNVGWDGYDRNHRLMPAGVYVYKLILRLSNGQRTTKIGDVTLIR